MGNGGRLRNDSYGEREYRRSRTGEFESPVEADFYSQFAVSPERYRPEVSTNLAAPSRDGICEELAIQLKNSDIKIGELNDYELWDNLRRVAVQHRLKFMLMHVERSEKDYLAIERMKIEIGNEVLKISKQVDEDTFKKPAQDNSDKYFEEWEKLQKQPLQIEQQESPSEEPVDDIIIDLELD